MAPLVPAVSVSVGVRTARRVNTSAVGVSAPLGGVACSVRRPAQKASLNSTVRESATVNVGPSATQ